MQRLHLCRVCTCHLTKPTSLGDVCKVRWVHGESGDYVKWKRWKRVFSTFLFGGTLGAALFFKQRRQQRTKELFRDCYLIPADNNYANPRMFYLYRDYVLPDFVVNARNYLRTFQIREDDVFVVSFPKTGTTWVQEIVYLISTNLDFKGAKAQGLESRFPFLEYVYPGLKSIDKMSSPRFIKSHLPLSLLPDDFSEKKPKVICILRNPKDVAVSFYHFVRMLTPTSYQGTFEEFLKTLLHDKVMYGPLWKHYLEFWDHRHDDNVLLLMYEEMHKDIRGCVEKVATFLGKSLCDWEVTQIVEHCSFENMAHNPSVNYQYWDDIGLHKKGEVPFMRKGQVGDWQNYFTQDTNSKMDEWIEKHLSPSGLQFTYTVDKDSSCQEVNSLILTTP